MRRFRDRREAGRALADRLGHLRHEDLVVLGLPRGGVPVAHEVARILGKPLDVLLVRKLGLPFQPELAMGAIGEEEIIVYNDAVMRDAAVSPDEFDLVRARERTELAKRADRYRPGLHALELRGRTALIVDDGIATGATARAACRVARARGAQRIVMAAPVAVNTSVRELAAECDEVIVVSMCEPWRFHSVGAHYDDFHPVEDAEVAGLLASLRPARASTAGAAQTVSHEVKVQVENGELEGRLTLPPGASALVVFAHGSGSSRHSPRNRLVARRLNQAGLGTLLFDLLTPAEEYDRRFVFDIDLLAERLALVTAQARGSSGWIGYFGASTGAAAALVAASDPAADVRAIVSRGGRPDLAMRSLPLVRARTLLIVGGNDRAVLELNREAARHMRCEHRFELVPGATHLFEEPGALERVADLACDWFVESETLGPVERSPASQGSMT